MSMDAGGLAQMTFNSSFNNGGSLGVPGSGFASRGKGSHIKRLSVPPQIATIDESQTSTSISTPRTSRSHLLAGLRTAPKSATIPSQQQRNGMEGGRFPGFPSRGADRVPQTATGTGFPQQTYATNQSMNSHQSYQSHQSHQSRQSYQAHQAQQSRMMYTLPEQVLAPPMLDIEGGDIPIDENMYAEIMSTNLFLAAQQQRLQQQLISVTAAAQQFQGLNLGMSLPQQQQVPSLPGMGFYQQQLQQGVQPIVQPVPGQPGLFCVYNPLTGQQSYIMDSSSPEDGSPQSYQDTRSHVGQQVPQFRAEISPPAESAHSVMQFPQTLSPPSGSPSPPHEVSMSALRRGHRKNPSFNPVIKTNIDTSKANVGPGPRSAALPPTPATGTFGPGQGRAGEHPIRQPRGPPSLEDLVAKPTSQHEGSKNFATRQRRRAVHNLVRAGIERRGDTRSLGYHSSGGTNTPASEKEFTFSDNDDATVRSGSLSSKPSLGSLRAVANGAIGSERKEKSGRDRGSPDSPFHSATPTSEDGGYFGSKFVDVRGEYAPSPSASGTSSPSAAAVVAGQGPVAQAPERRKTPMLVLSSAEKRKTPFM
ncbi:hypothetical protein N7522_000724 [Penicillium canescens]|uniref:Uncharacterized protein n=1 Tax=Penicillium canescens TaxID=5083 RepID=A0AAD6NDM7_PENCN|nr:uncharacterized protein N7446_007708 [Penicillium canescens]KAJ6018657.1 hypothetical protein N7522_000724 [Penicillium canescens]KAJ6056817.1 hypothetical protein N7460_000091 [Penicillium canescens]KAJ6058125.1 hypothetical protein N7446_007708 [Penicillium canescens]